MLEEIKKKSLNIDYRYLIAFILIFILTIILFIPMIGTRFATDTYNIMNKGYTLYAVENSLNDGRLFMGVFTLLCDIISLPYNIYIISLLIIALIVTCISVIILSKYVVTYKGDKSKKTFILSIIFSYITLFNFMYMDCLYFVEAAVMAISILMYILAAKCLVDKEKFYIIKTILLVIIGVFNYQATICMFFIMSFLFSILKNKSKIINSIVVLIKSGIIGVITLAVNLGFVKIFGKMIGTVQNRTGSISQIFDNLAYIIKRLHITIIATCNMFPNFLFLVFLLILFAVIVTYCIRKKSYNNIISLLLIILVAIFSSFLISLPTLTAFTGGRMRVSVGAIVGIIYIFILCNTNILDKKSNYNFMLYAILAIYILVNIYNNTIMMIAGRKINNIEKMQAQEINGYMEKYEEETGNKIQNIALIKSLSNPNNLEYSDKIKNHSTYAINALKCFWSAPGAINYYSGRKLKTICTDSNARILYYMNAGWDKEFICLDNTLYIKTYLY